MKKPGNAIKSAPKNGTKVDLYIEIHASPRSFGMSDSFWASYCWWDGKNWVHLHRGKPTEIFTNYVTRWAPAGSQKTDYKSEAA